MNELLRNLEWEQAMESRPFHESPDIGFTPRDFFQRVVRASQVTTNSWMKSSP
jgi:hypothetical protein